MQHSHPSFGFHLLPDYILRNYIIPYLDLTTILINFRTLSSYCYNSHKDKLDELFSEEQANQFKKLCKDNNYENLKDNFNKKFNQLIQNKDTILQCVLQFNFADVIRVILEDNNEIRVVQLCRLLLLLLHLPDKIALLDSNNFTELNKILLTEECRRQFREKMANILNFETLELNICEYGTIYTEFDDTYLNQLNRSTNFLYGFIGKLIEFQVQKIIQHDLKMKLQKLLDLTNELSDKWNNKAFFFDHFIETINPSKTTNPLINKMLFLFKRFEMDTPLNDFYDKYIYVESTLYDLDNIMSNRKNLENKLIRIEQMGLFYNKCKVNNNETEFTVSNEKFTQIDFLMTLSTIKPSLEINEDNFILTYILIKEYIDSYKI